MKLITRAIGLALVLGVLAVGTTSAATVPSVARANYLSFLNHVISYTTAISADIDDWQFASSIDDWDGMATASLHERNHARAEYKWLVNHKPSSTCFAKVWASHKLDTHYLDLAMSNLYLFTHNGNSAAGDRGLVWMKKANHQLDLTTAALKATRC